MYSYESLNKVSFLKIGGKAFAVARDFVAEMTKDKTKEYVDMIFAYKNDTDYKLIYVRCFEAKKGKTCPFIVDKTAGIY